MNFGELKEMNKDSIKTRLNSESTVDVDKEGISMKIRQKTRGFEVIKEDVLDWADDKDLLHEENAEKQFMKFIEEVFEFKTEMDSYKKDVGEMKNLSYSKAQDEMGDIFVTLVILCEQLELDPTVCLNVAYNKISKRRGKTINGKFYKQEDLEGMKWQK